MSEFDTVVIKQWEFKKVIFGEEVYTFTSKSEAEARRAYEAEKMHGTVISGLELNTYEWEVPAGATLEQSVNNDEEVGQ